jgi:hypothetical protein
MDIKIQDDAHLFGATDMQRLMSVNLPFDVHIITSTSSTSRARFESRVHDSIDAPNVVGIGIDPTHRWVVAHFGTGTGVAPSQWATIVASGNGDFRDARWTDGVLAITRNAASARTEASVSTAAYRDESSSAGIWIVGGFVLVVAVLIGFLVWRARRRTEAMFSGGTYGGYGYGSPTPVVVQQGSSNDLLTGVLIGEAMHPSPVVVHDTAASASYDAGSSFSSSSSFDAGGSSTSFGGSSFDGGGSFGGGGGGFDGGGGGSSF